MFINKLWLYNDVTLMTLHCVSCRVASLHLLGSSYGILENICTKFTHISQKWLYFSVHYTFYLYSLGRRNWLRCRGRFFGPHCIYGSSINHTYKLIFIRRPKCHKDTQKWNIRITKLIAELKSDSVQHRNKIFVTCYRQLWPSCAL